MQQDLQGIGAWVGKDTPRVSNESIFSSTQTNKK